jgi:hypothetical protein
MRQRLSKKRRALRAPKVAILLNKNARQVNARSIQALRRQAPNADFFVTSSLSEAEVALQAVAQGKYDLLFTGGGDGTVCHTITRVSELCRGKGAPDIGILPLGTGNAIASFLQSPSVSTCLRDASRARRAALSFPTARGDFGERKAAFGGFGWDAFVLDHYYKWRATCGAHALSRPFAQGLAAYLISGLAWAVPKMLLTRPRWDIKIYNRGEEAFQISPTGEVLKRVGRGEVIYEGPAQLCSFGSCPYFGFKLKALPFAAARPHLMHLRVADFSPIWPVLRLDKMWRGTYQHKRLWDFLASDFSIALSTPAAVQLGGDIVGHLSHLDVSLSAPASLLRYGDYEGAEVDLPRVPRQISARA